MNTVQIVRSYREDGATRHEVLLNLGRKDEMENNPMFQRLAQRLGELSCLHQAQKGLEVHWTEKRIKGHFVVCFLAFLLERKLEQQLNKAGVRDASPERIRDAINRMEFAEIEMQGQSYCSGSYCYLGHNPSCSRL